MQLMSMEKHAVIEKKCSDKCKSTDKSNFVTLLHDKKHKENDKNGKKSDDKRHTKDT